MKKSDLDEVKSKNEIRRGIREPEKKLTGPKQSFVALEKHGQFYREVEIVVQDGVVIKTSYGKDDGVMVARSKAFGLLIDCFRAGKK